MHTFISYASEQSELAREIALALRGEGHEVFLDRSQLPEGDAYDARIRQAIRDCDLLVFLISPEALSAGRYTLTELKFAEEKWPRPAGHLLPVMVKPTEKARIPAFLRSVTILQPDGNVAAEVVAAVARLARPWWADAVRRYAAAPKPRTVAAMTTPPRSSPRLDCRDVRAASASCGEGSELRPTRSAMPAQSAWKPSCDEPPVQSTRSAVCLRRNSSGILTRSINPGTSTPRSAAAAASLFTHSDTIELSDQSTTTLLAVSSSCSMA